MNKAGTYSYQGDEYQRVCCDLHKNNLFYDQNFRRISYFREYYRILNE